MVKLGQPLKLTKNKFDYILYFIDVLRMEQKYYLMIVKQKILHCYSKIINYLLSIQQIMTTISDRQRLESLETKKLSQSIKSMKWGQQNYQDQDSPAINASDKGNEHRKQIFHNAQIRHPNDQDYRHNNNISSVHEETTYQYEYSVQDTHNFKKNKPRDQQITRLLELKQQYEILKSMNIEESLIYTHKSKSNKEQSILAESAKSDAVSSKKSLHSQQQTGRNKNMLEYEKKQLELMLTNSMAKIQELLKSQIDYKRKIHELSTNRGNNQEQQIQDLIRNHNKQLKQLNTRIDSLLREEDHLRVTNKRLSERIGLVQADLLSKDLEIKKYQDQKKKIDQNAYVDREKIMTYEIEIKRLKMEYEIMQKDKNSEIMYLKRLREDTGSYGQNINQTEVVRLREQIKLKDHRYSLLVDQLEAMKLKNHQKPKGDNIFNQLVAKLQSNQQNNSEQSAVINQIRILKQHLESQKGDAMLEEKIKSLEKIIQEENLEKSQFMQELRNMSNDYDRIQKQNTKLKQELHSAQSEVKRLRRQLYGIKQQLEHSQNAKLSLSVSQDQNNMFVNKTLEKLENENKELRVEYHEFKQSSKIRDNAAEQQLRRLRRELDESKFRIQKLMKENAFNLQLANTKANSEIELLNKQIQRTIKQRDEWKRQFDSMKMFYERKLNEMRTQMDNFNEQWNTKINIKDQQILKSRGDVENNLSQLRHKYQSEQTALLARLDSLMQSNQRFAKDNAKLIHCQSQLYQLKQQVKRMYALNTNIDHLWSIKEAEYSNINDIIQDLH